MTDQHFENLVEEIFNDDLREMEEENLVETLIDIAVGTSIANKYQQHLGVCKDGKIKRIDERA